MWQLKHFKQMKRLNGKRIGILSTATVVAVVIIGFYYFYIEKNKEARVISQSFKTLYRYAQDLKEREREIYNTNNSPNTNYNQYDLDTELYEHVLDNHFFEGFIAFNDGKPTYNQFLNTSIYIKQNTKSISFSIEKLKILLENNENIEEKESNEQKLSLSIENSYECQMPITIKGIKYQLFIVKVDGGEFKYLAGLLSQSKYSSLKRGLDRSLISFITVFVILLIFSIPIIKLFVVSPGEQYTVRNLIVLINSCVGIVFIFCYFILYQTNINSIKTHVKNEHLHNISHKIKIGFNNEFDSLKNYLSDFKTALDSNKTLFKENTIDTSKIKVNDKLNHKNAMWQEAFIVIGKNYKKPDDTNITPDDKNKFGTIVYDTSNLNRYEIPEKKTDILLVERDYVVNPDKFKGDNFRYGFESIYSLSTAKPQVVISSYINSSSYIACLSSEMNSVYNTILPQHYSFCIIDKQGKVWFHKDCKNNIREDLFVETDGNPDLISAIKANRVDNFRTKYKMKPTLMRVEPLSVDLGLYLVTMCEGNNYIQIINHSGYIIIATYVLMLLFWIIGAWVYRKKSSQNSIINNPPNAILYFFPLTNGTKLYLHIAIVNMAVSIFFIALFVIMHQLIYVVHWFCIMAILGLLVLIWNSKLMKKKMDGNEKLFSSKMKLFLVIHVAIIFMAEILLHHFFSDFNEKNTSLHITFYILIVLNVVLHIIYRFIEVRQIKLSNEKNIQAYQKKIVKNYYTFIFSLIFSFVIAPLFVLYTTVYHQEISIFYNGQMRHVVEEVIQKNITLHKQQNKSEIIPEIEKAGNYYVKFHGMKECEKIDFAKVDSISKVGELKITNHYVKVFGQAHANMFFINNLIEDRGNRVKPMYIDSEDSDKTFIYFTKAGTLNHVTKEGRLPNVESSLIISMDIPGLLEHPRRFLGLLYGLIVILVFYLLVFPKISRKYLFPQIKYSQSLFDFKLMEEFIHNKKNGVNNYIVTMPDKAFYDQCVKNGNTNMYRIHIPHSMDAFLKDKIGSKHIYLFIDHMGFKGIKHLSAFVEHIEDVMKEDIVLSFNIVCFKEPNDLISHLRESLTFVNSKQNKSNDKRTLLLETTLKRLSNCLAYFSIRFIPIMNQPLKNQKPTDKVDNKIIWLDNELGKNAFMQRKIQLFQKLEILKQSDGEEVPEDEVYQAYLINKTYYQKIWDSCTNEEKSIIYDIADDYLINLHKNGVVNMLINKGLIKNGQFLSLFNLSFTHFVKHKTDEVLQINSLLRDENQTGWSQYSLPIKLLLAIIIIFIFITHQEFFTGIQSILISIGAILTFALRFFNFPIRSTS